MNSSRNIVRYGAAGALLAASILVGSTSTFAAARFDGLWSVSIITEKGDCDRGYRYPVRISNGALVNAGDQMFTVSGNVNANGGITVSVSAAGKSANGSGKLAGAAGGGSWHGGQCSGSWTAERRGS